MVAALYPYKDRVEITGLAADNAFHNVSVSSYLEYPDKATGVLLQMEVDTTGQPGVTAFGIEQLSDAQISTIVNGGYTTGIAWFNPGDLRIRGKRQNSNCHVYIVGELRDDVCFHLWSQWEDAIELQPVSGAGEENTWIDKTVTLIGDDSYSDIEAAIIQVHCQVTNGYWGARKKGSTTPGIVSSTGLQGFYWRVVPIDANGQYQTYFTAKTGPPWGDHFRAVELGYIKKGSYKAIAEPSDMGLASDADWFSLALSGTVPDTARVVVASWLVAGSTTNPYGYLKPIGSSLPPRKVSSDNMQGDQVIRLSRDLRCLARLNDSDLNLYVMGYENYVRSGGVRIQAGALNIQ